MNKRKYLVYKITNRFNGKIYIGCHSTLNENDRYMGSGVEIKEALKKEGRKSFVKEILFTFDNKEEMLSKEKELVTKEFCMRENTYNRIEGGGVYGTVNMVTVKDIEGNTSLVYKDDPRYISGELVSFVLGKVYVKDENGKTLQINKNDPRWISKELKSINVGKFVVKDEIGNTYLIDKADKRYLTGELIPIFKGVSRPNKWKGRVHSEETKKKMSESGKNKVGEKNPSFGSCWITKEGLNKKIKKEELNNFINQGWIKGRKYEENIH